MVCAWQVEVKGPNDTLMETQKAWLVILFNAGVQASTCRLVERDEGSDPSKKRKRRESQSSR